MVMGLSIEEEKKSKNTGQKVAENKKGHAAKTKKVQKKVIYEKFFGPIVMVAVLLLIIIFTIIGFVDCKKDGYRKVQFIPLMMAFLSRLRNYFSKTGVKRGNLMNCEEIDECERSDTCSKFANCTNLGELEVIFLSNKKSFYSGFVRMYMREWL